MTGQELSIHVVASDSISPGITVPVPVLLENCHHCQELVGKGWHLYLVSLNELWKINVIIFHKVGHECGCQVIDKSGSRSRSGLGFT